jgi:hypothetical protein
MEHALHLIKISSITHPTMLANYNLRGQEAPANSGAFFLNRPLLSDRILSAKTHINALGCGHMVWYNLSLKYTLR